MPLAIVVAVLVAVLIPLFMFGGAWRGWEEKARERRMAEHRMNARLLRMDI